jgi:class 3 adenylate cyclase
VARWGLLGSQRIAYCRIADETVYGLCETVCGSFQNRFATSLVAVRGRKTRQMPRCAVCAHISSEPFRFCPNCGAPAADAPREERKTVTVLFCDVVGSTELSERLDPESVRRVLARFFETVREVVERHGGSVEKFIGDAVMAVFGVPVLHEDDAFRAVRAAAELRERLDRLNGDLARDFGMAIEHRMGINTGEVVAGTEERAGNR